MIQSNRHLTIREIAENLNFSNGSVQNILTTDLNMRQVSAKFDNAPCHTSLLVRQFLSNKNIMVCPHPPYSPDLAPNNFWLFPKVKMSMKGKRFESFQDIETATKAQLSFRTIILYPGGVLSTLNTVKDRIRLYIFYFTLPIVMILND
jgi:histone-lysine N-methyltransferase SETMAR